MTDEHEVGEDTSLEDLLEQLHAELQATEELPVEREAGRWIGEAQAVAADVAGGDLDEDVVHERVGHVRELLTHVDETGHDEVDGHVQRARVLAASICDRT